MAFLQEGDVPVQIRNAMIADSTLNKKPGSYDIALEVVNEDGTQSDWYRANMSGDYSRMSNKGHLTNTQVSYERLVELGYKGPDFSGFPTNANIDWAGVEAALKNMAGIITSAHVERSTCGRYINIKWLGGGGNAPTPVNLAQLSQQMQGNAAAATTQPVSGGFANVQQNNNGAGGFGQKQSGGFSQQ